MRLRASEKTMVQLLEHTYGRGNQMVKVSERDWPCHEFKTSTTKDPPCMAATHGKSVERSNVLQLVWCGI
ncbi:hypothetical protein TNCV_2810071 [Trichonephila clavipes]|nr:hypothetical protein TNCV_2810071 [Trichonephila clavipes]